MKNHSSPVIGPFPFTGCRGFTLFELLLSMTIVAVVVALVLGVFRVGYRAWEKGDKAIDSLQRLRGISDRIHRQLTAAVFVRPSGEESTRKGFTGTERSMRFTSDSSLVPGIPRGRVIVRYRVDESDEGGQQLMFHELPVIVADPEDDDIPPDEAFYRLLQGMDRISFEYLKRDGENPDAEPQWQANWDPGIDGNLPSAVRVWIQQEAGAPPIGVISRIAASKLE